ncbi:MAG: saccharopine dehydrogenase NADP-binding domain-containing protein, partial [Actinomycetota bacterium]|nr:saccharopine dehydrogenase NADP-binding domain-containing protein [Actinomycetota bacterium]
MAGRVVLFGATGYTGGLVAAALVRCGELPLLVGRDSQRLARRAATLERDGRRLATATADAGDESSLARVVAPGDVVVSTVGPFLRLGEPAVRVAVATGAVYLDSTGEPPFLRRVFEEHGPRAGASGAVLLPAFGYDYVPGNLAGALALRAAGAAATRVDVGYFRTGAGGVSGGTAASAAGVLLEPGFAWRSGRLQPERPGARTRVFPSLGGRSRRALSVGGSEHLTLPTLHPGLDTVGVYLGWAGPLTPLVAALSAPLAAAARLPVLRRGLDAVQARIGPRPG